MSINRTAHDASFRDPSGYVFYDSTTLRRRIFPIYFKQYNALVDRGVFDTLSQKRLLIPHTLTSKSDTEIIITPTAIPFITYPYEWSFEQYKQAALLTLKIQKYVLSRGFSLKDASAYNVTMYQGNPIFIDTLSFDFYEQDSPWRAYKQFITHFLGPLVLAKYFGTDMLKMMQSHIDGIPLALLSSLLPIKTKLSPTIQSNIHLLAKLEGKHNDDYKAETKVSKLSLKAQNSILDNLYKYIQTLTSKNATEWGDYYTKTNYGAAAFESKKLLIKNWVTPLRAQRIIDVGGNDGTFVRALASDAHLIVTDIDSNAVAQNFIKAQQNKESNMLTFVSDVLQPSAGIGFNNTERSSLIARLKAYEPDVTMALALIHHITLSGNVPFEKSASFFASFSKILILEFPKREDSWAQSLLIRKREFIDHFDFYNEQHFEESYQKFFKLEKKEIIAGTSRVLYFFKKE